MENESDSDPSTEAAAAGAGLKADGTCWTGANGGGAACSKVGRAGAGCQLPKAAMAACGGVAARWDSTANGDAAGWIGAENGAGAVGAGGVASSNGDAAKARAGASNPKPSDGSATWKGESLRRSGNLADLPDSTLESLASSTTVNGESWRATAVNGLTADSVADS
ncbi:MAG: hypothetical protein ABI162_09190 [Luteolibacter sp.]